MRVVTVPAAILPAIATHLEEYAQKGPDGLLFIGPKRGPLRRSNFQEHWTKGTTAAGIEGLHFHDLRHAGNTWAAETGATLRDLMDRMGHDTTRAALIYLHKTAGRDQVIADRLEMIEKTQAPEDDDGDAENPLAN